MTRTPTWSAHALVCTLAFAFCAAACGPEPEDPEITPPDEEEPDDDETVDEGFGDYDSVSFRFLLQATPADAERGDDPGDDDDSGGDDDDSGGDDDDSAGDDDDSAGDDDDSAAPLPEPGAIAIEYTVVYWSDYDNGGRLCEQVMVAEGIVQQGGFNSVDACENCRGLVTVDAASVTDISDPASNPLHCDPEVLAGTEDDYGGLFLSPPSEGGAGDFLSIALLDGEVWDAMDLDSGAGTFEDLQIDLATNDLVLTHGGLLKATSDTFAGQVDLAQIASPVQAGSPWIFFWILYTASDSNPNAGWELDGLYGGGALWRYLAQ